MPFEILGDPHPEDLELQFKQGEVMQEWKRKKMERAKLWYDKAIYAL